MLSLFMSMHITNVYIKIDPTKTPESTRYSIVTLATVS